MITHNDQKPKIDVVMQLVENQIRDNDPPEARTTFYRLKNDLKSEEAAKKLIRRIALFELGDVITKYTPFNYERYIESLNLLPKFPWETQ